jgi:hypothetical protein
MRADITAEQLVEFFERVVQKLVEQGVPAERITDALNVMSVRAGVRYGVVGPSKLTAAVERLRVASEHARSSS